MSTEILDGTEQIFRFRMKLSRREVPLYGEARVYALIEVCEDAEVYVVLEGSSLKHVIPVRHHNMFYFITPGHNREERVCVRAFRHTVGGLECVGVASLLYISDEAQQLAEFLVTHSNQLTSSTHRQLIGRYRLTDSCMRTQMDKRVTVATANLQLPLTLLHLNPQESLLHVAVRLEFECFVEFLLCQPGGLMAASTANEDGDTPIQLAQQAKQTQILHLLTSPPNPLCTPLAGQTHVWVGPSMLFRFSHQSQALVLSERECVCDGVCDDVFERVCVCEPECVGECRLLAQKHQAAILLLRECVTDYNLLSKIHGLKTDSPSASIGRSLVFGTRGFLAESKASQSLRCAREQNDDDDDGDDEDEDDDGDEDEDGDDEDDDVSSTDCDENAPKMDLSLETHSSDSETLGEDCLPLEIRCAGSSSLGECDTVLRFYEDEDEDEDVLTALLPESSTDSDGSCTSGLGTETAPADQASICPASPDVSLGNTAETGYCTSGSPGKSQGSVGFSPEDPGGVGLDSEGKSSVGLDTEGQGSVGLVEDPESVGFSPEDPGGVGLDTDDPGGVELDSEGQGSVGLVEDPGSVGFSPEDPGGVGLGAERCVSTTCAVGPEKSEEKHLNRTLSLLTEHIRRRKLSKHESPTTSDPANTARPCPTASESEQPSQDSTASSQRKRSNSEGCASVVSNNPPSYSPSPCCEAGCWAEAVEAEFYKSLDHKTIKRQEIIYELTQTEKQYVQTLSVMSEGLRRGLQEECQLGSDVIGQMLPCVDKLLPLHHNFLVAMETRQRESSDPSNPRNFLVLRIGDILTEQFSGDCGSQMTSLYGEFCSKHTPAVSLYKQLLQNNRKLQAFVKQQRRNTELKRREIPELLLLVTQRITKYPILLERLLQYTEEGSMEVRECECALQALRAVLNGVERSVCERQREETLTHILRRLDSRSSTRLRSGEIFSKQHLLPATHTHTHTHTHTRTLTHSGALTCRTSSGRLRECLGVLLGDILVFLQEKDQKLTFAPLEQKSAVVSLQNLIVREVANQDRGLFLITESSTGPEMYEIHTHTREERNTWLTHLTKTAHSLLGNKKQAELEDDSKSQNLQAVQESLLSLDMQVCVVLEEKLRVFADLGGWSQTDLLVWPRPQNIPQASMLLTEAKKEVEKLAVTLMLWYQAFIWLPGNNQQLTTKVMEGVEPMWVPTLNHTHHLIFKVSECVHSVTRLLLSLQAAVIIQDSIFEVQKLQLVDEVDCCHGDKEGVSTVKEGVATMSSEDRLAVGEQGSSVEEDMDMRALEEELHRVEQEGAELNEQIRVLQQHMEKLKEEELELERDRQRVRQEK